MQTRFVILSVLFMMLFLQPGWAGEMPKEQYIQEMTALKQRFYAYMSNRKANDFNGIYEMLSSEYKTEISLEKFKELPFESTMNLMAYFIQAIDLKGDSATVYFMEFAISPGIPTPSVRTHLFQHWVKEDDQWFYNRDTDLSSFDFSACGGIVPPEIPETMPKFQGCGATHPMGGLPEPGSVTPPSGKACGK